MDYFERAEPQAEPPSDFQWKAQEFLAKMNESKEPSDWLNEDEERGIMRFARWLDEGGDKEEQPIPF